MKKGVIKRWVVIGGLLILTLWLVWAAPIVDEEDYTVVNPIRSSTSVNNEKGITVQENIFSMQPRHVANEKAFDIFNTQKKTVLARVKPIVRVRSDPEPAKPKVPNLPFTYIGKLVENNRVKIFLMKGQALHIVSQGDKIGRNYKLTHVNKQQIRFLYLPLSITQVINLEKVL